MFLYENHMGGLFFMEEELGWEDLYCETCGESDWPLGECGTREEALALIATDYDAYGGYDRDYVEDLLDQTFGPADAGTERPEEPSGRESERQTARAQNDEADK